MSLFCCPLCAAPLTRGDHAYTCPGGHSFDLAAAGYVHLLPANRKHSQNPGDDTVSYTHLTLPTTERV